MPTKFTIEDESISLGNAPALIGALRLENNTGIFARNSLNTRDVSLLLLEDDDDLVVGGSSALKDVRIGHTGMAGTIHMNRHVLMGTTNVYDFGAVGGSRPRDLFMGRAIYHGAENVAASLVSAQGEAPVSGDVINITTTSNVKHNVTLPPAIRGRVLFYGVSGPSTTIWIYPALGDQIVGENVDAPLKNVALGGIFWAFKDGAWRYRGA